MIKPRMWWAGDDKGWMVESVPPLTPSEIKRSIDYTLKVQLDRYLTLKPGDRKDECKRTILALKEGRVTQNLTQKSGDIVLYDAWDKQISPRTYFT